MPDGAGEVVQDGAGDALAGGSPPVADHAAYEAFMMGKLSGLPAVLRLESHLTMKTIKVDG
ncbi:hypothetical protein GCM10010304_02700 [Streptomyces roseoviolaceus]